MSGLDEGLDLLYALWELGGLLGLWGSQLPGVRSGEMFVNNGLWGRLVVVGGLPCRQDGCERAGSNAVWELGLWRCGGGHRRGNVLGKEGRYELGGGRGVGRRGGELGWCDGSDSGRWLCGGGWRWGLHDGRGEFELVLEGLTVGARGLELGTESDELVARLVALDTVALCAVAQIALLLLLAPHALGDALAVHVLASALPVLEGNLEGGLVLGVARIGDMLHVGRADVAARGVDDAIVVEELPGGEEGGYAAVVSDGDAVRLVAAGQWVHY